jgi:queuine/archaeosine tRNA-ribosyltransferase
VFSDLYRRLRDYYKEPENQWADWYVLPDCVPTSDDSSDIVDRKVNETITAAKMLFAEMPCDIQQRSIPVIQGHTFDQVNRCIAAYRSMGQRYLGFGSFGTSGANNSINVTDKRSAGNVAHIASELESDGVRLHTFGVSTPPVIYAFQRLGIFSFDSMAWLRSAGYGKAFLPFVRAYNVSHRSTRNSALTEAEFERIKIQTGHRCPFCDSFGQLSKNRLSRALHNLVAVMETVDSGHGLTSQEIAALISRRSSSYHRMFKEIYLD